MTRTFALMSLACPGPRYTWEARDAKLTGFVLLEITITPEGRPRDILLLRRLGKGLDEAAIDAVRTWVFKPATDPDGNPVAVRVPVEVNFRLLQ